jgi:hypothetical protein
MYGVMTAIMQFQSQLDAVESPMPRARIGSGKISPTMVQEAGPQVVAKKAMYMPSMLLELNKQQLEPFLDIQMNAIIVLVAAWLPASTVPTIAMINWQTTIPKAPYRMSVRRPNLSMVQNANGVVQTLTRVVIREIKNGFLIVPRLVKNTVPAILRQRLLT